MRCPTDGSSLVIMERKGLEIDYCPDCRGVWIERDELDKLIDGNEQGFPSSMSSESAYAHSNRPARSSLINELFDF